MKLTEFWYIRASTEATTHGLLIWISKASIPDLDEAISKVQMELQRRYPKQRWIVSEDKDASETPQEFSKPKHTLLTMFQRKPSTPKHTLLTMFERKA